MNEFNLPVILNYWLLKYKSMLFWQKTKWHGPRKKNVSYLSRMLNPALGYNNAVLAHPAE